MYGKIILAAAVLAIATPVLAKSAPADLPTGPVAYSDLAAVDAKMNPAAAPAKAKHMHHAKAKAAAAPAADAKAPAKP